MNDKEIAKRFLEEHKTFLQKWDVKYGVSVIIPELKIKRRVVTEKIIFTDDDYFNETSEQMHRMHSIETHDFLVDEEVPSQKASVAGIDLDPDLEKEMRRIVTETAPDPIKKESGEDPVKQSESSKLKKMLGLR